MQIETSGISLIVNLSPSQHKDPFTMRTTLILHNSTFSSVFPLTGSYLIRPSKTWSLAVNQNVRVWQPATVTHLPCEISISTLWTGIQLCTDIHGLQRMKPADAGIPMVVFELNFLMEQLWDYHSCPQDQHVNGCTKWHKHFLLTQHVYWVWNCIG